MILHPLSLSACPLFEHWNSVTVSPSNIIFAPKPWFTIKTSASYLEKSIWICIQITYFRVWNSPTFHRFQLSVILFAFLQTNLDRFFWKIPTFYYL